MGPPIIFQAILAGAYADKTHELLLENRDQCFSAGIPWNLCVPEQISDKQKTSEVSY